MMNQKKIVDSKVGRMLRKEFRDIDLICVCRRSDSYESCCEMINYMRFDEQSMKNVNIQDLLNSLRWKLEDQRQGMFATMYEGLNIEGGSSAPKRYKRYDPEHHSLLRDLVVTLRRRMKARVAKIKRKRKAALEKKEQKKKDDKFKAEDLEERSKYFISGPY